MAITFLCNRSGPNKAKASTGGNIAHVDKASEIRCGLLTSSDLMPAKHTNARLRPQCRESMLAKAVSATRLEITAFCRDAFHQLEMPEFEPDARINESLSSVTATKSGSPSSVSAAIPIPNAIGGRYDSASSEDLENAITLRYRLFEAYCADHSMYERISAYRQQHNLPIKIDRPALEEYLG